jgi:precorrin-3B methylase
MSANPTPISQEDKEPKLALIGVGPLEDDLLSKAANDEIAKLKSIVATQQQAIGELVKGLETIASLHPDGNPITAIKTAQALINKHKQS